MKKAWVLVVILIFSFANLGLARIVTEHYRNGRLKSVQVYYKSGEIKGPYRSYWPNGKLKLVIRYRHGRPYLTLHYSKRGNLLK